MSPEPGFDQIRRYLVNPPVIRKAIDPIHFLATGQLPIEAPRLRSS